MPWPTCRTICTTNWPGICEALAAADLITDERAAQAGLTSPVRGFYPSLHLNLGECYRKLGDLDRAYEHLQRGRAAVHALGNDGYGRMIKGGLDSLAERLSLIRPHDDRSSAPDADVSSVSR